MDEATVAALLSAPKLEGVRRALCVQPHPDDNEIGMGGTIAWLAARGCEVDYLTVTDGALGDTTGAFADSPGELARVRRVEAEASGRLLGVRGFRFFDLPDGSLSDVPTLAGMVAETVREGGYDAVFCPDPWSSYEAHWDHVVTGRAVAQAAISCSLAQYPAGTATAPAQLALVGFYFTAVPNAVVDVTEFGELKMRAIAAHASQINAELLEMYGAYFAVRGARLAAEHGMGEGRAVEGLKLLSPLHLHCFPEASEIR